MQYEEIRDALPVVNDGNVLLSTSSPDDPTVGLVYTDSTVTEFSAIGIENKGEISFFSAVMNLLNSLIGAELLSISNSMTFCGLVVSVVLMTCTAMLSYVATIMTVRLQFRTGEASLNQMARRLLGKWGSFALSILTLLFTYSCCVAYLIIAGTNIQSWLTLLGKESWMEGMNRSLVMLVYSIVLPVALTIPRKMTFLSIFSTVSIFLLIAFIAVLTWKATTQFIDTGIDKWVVTARINLGLFNALAIYALMFALPAIILPVITKSNPRIGVRYKIIGTAFFCCFLFVLVPGVLGYLMFGADTAEIVLDNFDDTDIVIQVIRVAFFVVVTASYPVIVLTISTDLGAMMFGMSKPGEMPLKQRSIVLLIANIPPVVVAMFCPSIKPVLAIGGALGGCLTNFFFPGILWVANSSHRWFYWANLLCIALAGFGLISAAIATYRAFYCVLYPESST